MRLGVAAALVGGSLVAGDVEVAGGDIAAVGLGDGSRGSGLAAPGFVDLQVNGFAGVDFMHADAAAHAAAGAALAATGVTAYRPTLITAPQAELVDALRGLPTGRAGAPCVLGAHLEGPFLHPAQMGTHLPEHRRDPDRQLLERLLAAGPVAHVTLAPELPGALDLVDLLAARGVSVAAGHSDATAAQAHAAFDRGVRTVTHLFNAMRAPTAREPGLALAALARPDVTVQLIADGHHVADDAVRVAWAAASGRLALVTDAAAAAGAGDGSFTLGGRPVRAEGGVVRDAGGRLAGSALTMHTAVRRLHALGIPLAGALAAATMVPAAIAGRPELGTLAPGSPADVVVLDDRLEVVAVLVGGAAA
ncbi:MAG TPA: N-acetylglucosamine-6-phosphate deacetylase [Solirubrobacteraceae bacterium]|nr:N-acetylglucosamine-6-phosphate deacetylase [Solirubrobacteraceae bacterium]